MVNSWADILFIHFVGRFQVTCTRMMKKKGIILIEDLYSNRFSTVTLDLQNVKRSISYFTNIFTKFNNLTFPEFLCALFLPSCNEEEKGKNNCVNTWCFSLDLQAI